MNTTFYAISTISGIAVAGFLGYSLYFGPYAQAKRECNDSIFVVNEMRTTLVTEAPAKYRYDNRQFKTKEEAFTRCMEEKDRMIKKYTY